MSALGRQVSLCWLHVATWTGSTKNQSAVAEGGLGCLYSWQGVRQEMRTSKAKCCLEVLGAFVHVCMTWALSGRSVDLFQL